MVMTHEPQSLGAPEIGVTVGILRWHTMEKQVVSDPGKLCLESVIEPETSSVCFRRILTELVVGNPTTDRAMGWDLVGRARVPPPWLLPTGRGEAAHLTNPIDSGC